VERYTGDTRRIDYFILNEQSIAPVAEPTEEELAAYLTEHQEEFRTEETRSVDLTALSPETLAATKTVSEADIAAEYERTRASRTNPERRHIQQVALTTDAQQEIFESGLASGESFEDLVAEAGVTPRDLGTRSATEITDAALAEAAFGLAEGEFVIIPGIGGQRAVAVTAIEPGGEVSLAEVRDEIAQSLAEDEARDEYLDVLDQIEELRAAFQPLSQIAERFGLEVYPVTVSADGSELAEVPAVPEEDRQQVASNIFAAEAEQLTPAIMLSANHSVWFDLKEIVPARDQTLGEVREAVRTAIMDERTATALSAETERLLAELDAGTPFAEVAAEAGHQPVTSEAFGRSGSSIGGIGPEVAAAAFTGGEDHHGAAVSGAGEHVVFEVAEIIPATESASAEIAQYMEQTTRDSLFAEFVGGIRDEAGLRINRQAFDQLIALDPATGL
jgi:peptidyl-prolyl cis-trans isomerase D